MSNRVKSIDKNLKTELVEDLCEENAHLLFIVNVLKQL